MERKAYYKIFFVMLNKFVRQTWFSI